MKSAISQFTARVRASRKLKIACIAALVLVCFGIWGLIAYILDPYDCRIVDSVTIDGVELGGMTRFQAYKTLKSEAKQTLLSQPLVVELPEKTLTLDPKDVDLQLDVRQAVTDAYAVGRKTDASAAISSDLSVYIRCDETDILNQLLAYASEFDTELNQYQCRLEGDVPDLGEAGFDPAVPCPNLLVTLGTPENHLNIPQVQTQILSLYSRGISAVSAGNYSLIVPAEPEQLPENPDITKLYAEFAVEATDACPDLNTYEIIPASYGLIFDQEAAQKALDAAPYGETIVIPMTYREPEVLSDNVYFRDVLGTCETKHTDDENRNTNLRLVCEILNGLILEPGEEFSYNGVVGERTEERGFKPAGAYSGTRLVKDIGGGVCQGSSTLYNCVLLADLEVTERVCHGLLVNYLPIGLDAAVNWATKTDFKFRNNFHFPIMLQAELSDGYMKMKILGTDEKDYYVEMRSGRSDDEHRIYSNSYKYKYSKETGELLSKDLEARSSYMYFTN